MTPTMPPLKVNGAADDISGHPEELLDRVRAGSALGSEQWLALQTHLSACPLCALQFRTEAVSSMESSTTATDTYVQRLATETVLRRLQRGVQSPAVDRSRNKAWGRPAAIFRARLRLAAGMVLFSGTAAAATWWTAHQLVERSSLVAAGPPRVTATGPTDEPQAAPAPAAPVEQAPPPTNARQATDRERTLAQVETKRLHQPQPSAAELFDRARRLRLGGDPAGARAVYRRLQSQHPHSPQSLLSHLILGRLFLNGDRPELAATQFGKYLAGGGDAAEEALAGHAGAMRELGRAAEEVQDWRTLLARHPRSVYAERARARLTALERTGFAPPRPGQGR